jgi:hypothetical protein
MRRLTLEITAKAKLELEKAVRTHPKPYIRERAFALLKVAEGLLIEEVAALLPLGRQPRSVSGWVKRYKEKGFEGLLKSPGGGRKPSFSPLGRGGGPAEGRAAD